MFVKAIFDEDRNICGMDLQNMSNMGMERPLALQFLFRDSTWANLGWKLK